VMVPEEGASSVDVHASVYPSVLQSDGSASASASMMSPSSMVR
jgi:hypothetical protein